MVKETAKGTGNWRKAHSWRGAAASAAIDQGVTVADIVKTADWSRETTFTNYYYGVGADKEKYLNTGKEEGSYISYCTTLLQTYRVTSEACDDMKLKVSPGPRSASETISDRWVCKCNPKHWPEPSLSRELFYILCAGHWETRRHLQFSRVVWWIDVWDKYIDYKILHATFLVMWCTFNILII